jgi:hypothetical protein
MLVTLELRYRLMFGAFTTASRVTHAEAGSAD